MPYFVYTVLSLTIGAGALTGLWRYRKIERRYLPFVWLTWAGFGNEVAANLLVRQHSNIVLYNVYACLEFFLLCLQFERWGLFRRRPSLYYVLQICMLGLWCTESLCFDIFMVNSYFLIISSFAVVLMGIETTSEMLFFESYRLLRNSKFLICSGLILFFSYSILVEMFWVFGLKHSVAFRVRIYEILYIINAFTNLVFALAILWMPMRPRYILQW